MAIKDLKIAVHADNKKQYQKLCEVYRLSKFPKNNVVDWNRSRGRDPDDFVHIYAPKNDTSAELVAVALARLYAVLKSGDYLVDDFRERITERFEEHFKKSS